MLRPTLTALFAATLLAGCNSSSNTTNALQTNNPVGLANKAPTVQGAPEVATLSGKGGTGISVLVNDQPITNSMIQRRVAFVKLRRMKGNATTIAREELVNEAIQMQEARRIGAVAGSGEVDAAYLRFAQGNKIPPPELDKIMARSGVTKRGFKDYIKAQISWQRAAGAKQSADARGVTSQQTQGPAWLPAVGEKVSDVKEYTLQQIVFVVPTGKSGLVTARKQQANSFRSRFAGCESTNAQAAALKDVSVLDRGRVLAYELPPQWRKAVEALKVGGVTPPQQTPKGVEMLALCKSRDVATAVPKSAELFSEGNVSSDASAFEKKFLAELKEKAKIVRR
ncbi:peptidylprolyl isomerase [Rhizobiaceae bacterium]|nr:peptidylprolyl isomerase [Rhizobiaceae bacterium]